MERNMHRYYQRSYTARPHCCLHAKNPIVKDRIVQELLLGVVKSEKN